MLIKILKVNSNWFRVLGLSNVYSKDREVYEENVYRVGKAEFLNSAGVSSIRRGSSSNRFVTVFDAEDSDYSKQVFLTYTEFKNVFVEAAQKFVNKNEGLGLYIHGGIINTDFILIVHRVADASYAGNVYKDMAPAATPVYSFKVDRPEFSAFDSQEEKDAYVKKEVKQYLAVLKRKYKEGLV